MAYVDNTLTSEIRNDLKAAFPDWRFSVRKDGHTAVRVTIMSGPKDLEVYYGNSVIRMNNSHHCVNPYWIDQHHPEETAKFLNEVKKIVTKRHWDKSDAMIDYFNCAFYYDISVGRFDQPFTVKE